MTMSPASSSGTSSSITASVGPPALTITTIARGRRRLATKSAIDSLGTNAPSPPCSATRLRVRSGDRLCSATTCPCRAKLRARLRPITARPVTPMSASFGWLMRGSRYSARGGLGLSSGYRTQYRAHGQTSTGRGRAQRLGEWARRLLFWPGPGGRMRSGREIAGSVRQGRPRHDARSGGMVDTSPARVYTSWWQARSDAWSRLEEASRQLAGTSMSGQADGGLVATTSGLLDALAPVEQYWAFPGPEVNRRMRDLFASASYDRFALLVARISRALVTESYRASTGPPPADIDDDEDEPGEADAGQARPYFEVLVVEPLTAAQEQGLREELHSWRRADDHFVYELVVVGSAEEAVIAAQLNANLQACVIRRGFAPAAAQDLSGLADFADGGIARDLAGRSPDERTQILARRVARLRPELDLYLTTEISVEDIAGHLSHHFRRVFHAQEGMLELHLSILAGVGARYHTPFFEALRRYSHRPTGVFHALPISQGKSILSSHWIGDMLGFYGLDIFLAETSATGGGLDSLLEPTGPLRQAQQLAAETFGARRTYFVTNGTSTANKIVAQALIAPGDIVLVDRNCHQSHHYGLMLAGAHVVYLDAYPLHEYSMYGGVPLREIKSRLLALRAAGKLDRVKLLMLTNCTFDGVVYDAERVMEECLAIKPDLVFLWDEAWFAFARFHPVYRPRTAMRAARTLAERLRSPEHRAAYARQAEELGGDDEALLARRLLPDPARARVRVYATQSTHKTLTSLRQGSMI